MKPGMKIWIILVSIVLFWGGVFCFVCCADNLENRATDMAEKALKASVHNPESIRILGVSKPDSVFGHTYITQEEKMALSLAMVEINRKVMDVTDGLENFNPDDKETAALMERQMSAMSSLRRLMDFSGPLDGSPQQFSGWKVKVDFEGMDADGRSYHSEYWFILDKEAQCVVKSFEIPLP